MQKQLNWSNLASIQKGLDFSGAFYVEQGKDVHTGSYGYANRSENRKNQANTRFSIASGCKLFTSVAICQLVEEGGISFDTKLMDVLDVDFPYFDKHITIHHLLTHTSGVPDYFDEEEMDDFEVLWESLPMYHVRKPSDFLPLFQTEKMTATVGSDFHYNNAGYILLGLIIEQVTGGDFASYIEKHIFQQIGMSDSGYFATDELPERVALGYIKKPDGTWKTNTFSLPAKGGPDGGAYVTVKDMGIFWKALMNNELLTKEMTHILLEPREMVAEDIYYGYGGYMETNENGVVKFIQMGYDPGVNFRAVHYLDSGLTIVVCSNEDEGAYEMLNELEDMMG